ncbi:flagellar hook protein FlgE [Cellvibrio sp. NN19]|uniref:flagellar hook protein FlgE n=1 Tax=Cellvibrio chitinivorans TaxID=3102792 RepID=UPI002B40832A|nr:flagellar hook protein FlgE [Cellvibrio sp. NN19]
MSFNIALTGLSAVNDQLDSISNNISNVGTTGFKSSRTEFGSIYSDSMAMGVEVLRETQSISKGGSLVTTGRETDLAISGGGFFMTKASTGETNYTRAGVFGTDKNNYIVNASGQRLQGYPVDGSNRLQTGSLSDMQLKNANIAAKATDKLDFVMNLDANESTPTIVPFDPNNIDTYNSTYTTKVFDSQGKEHTLTQYFVKTGANSWDAHYFIDGNAAANSMGTQALTFNANGHMTSPYDYAGELANDPAAPPVHTPMTLTATAAQLGGGVADLNIEMNYGGTGIGGATQYGSNFIVNSNTPTGYTSGEQIGIAIEKDGMVYATYSNGQRQLQGQVALATFTNLDGLQNVNGTSWVETVDSGQPLVGVPGIGAFGDLTSGALENSNVDLTQQLVALMESQRNYQANTKVLSTDKELTQVLFGAI